MLVRVYMVAISDIHYINIAHKLNNMAFPCYCIHLKVIIDDQTADTNIGVATIGGIRVY